MNLCPFAPNCRRAEECNSPHPEATKRECYLPASTGWEPPILDAPRADEAEREPEPIVPPAVDPALLAMIDAVLAEPERETRDPAAMQGGLF
jgi:hypothetical protein